jgi:hypothetical protein
VVLFTETSYTVGTVANSPRLKVFIDTYIDQLSCQTCNSAAILPLQPSSAFANCIAVWDWDHLCCGATYLAHQEKIIKKTLNIILLYATRKLEPKCL